MRESDRLSPLEMGIAGEHNILEAPCRRDKRTLQLSDGLLQEIDLSPAPELDVGCDLIISGASGVKLLAEIAHFPDK